MSYNHHYRRSHPRYVRLPYEPQPPLSGLEWLHIEELIRAADAALKVLANIEHKTWPVTPQDAGRARAHLFDANVRAWRALKALRGE